MSCLVAASCPTHDRIERAINGGVGKAEAAPERGPWQDPLTAKQEFFGERAQRETQGRRRRGEDGGAAEGAAQSRGEFGVAHRRRGCCVYRSI